MIRRFEKRLCGFCCQPATRICYCDTSDPHTMEAVWICDNPVCLKMAERVGKVRFVSLSDTKYRW